MYNYGYDNAILLKTLLKTALCYDYVYRVQHPGEFYDEDPPPTAVTMET